ncbi:MAG: YraN family protein [Parvibaculaceae bacterium]|nr:YraN family protein [Parvibaculaceae bacterium]
MTAGRGKRRQERGRANQRTGLRAEALARLVLRLKGYRILGSRVRTRAGEIDLVARRGRVLAFVEVKSRQAQADARLALQPRQQYRLARAAEAWAAGRRELEGLIWRYDLMICAPRRLPRHLMDAWRPQERF